MTCRLCEERGKTWAGDDPVCAFENGIFSANNWACATMSKLREITRDNDLTTRCDMSAGTFGYVRVDNDYAPETYEGTGGYIAMAWYKERGRVGNAVFMTDETTMPLTIEHAEIAIKTYEKELEHDDTI
ncbi:hypothetical protein ACRPLG_02510 [Bacillus safensis]|uniref:hypothetical protein n=1 Tax=Bacillus safensis TaxID=561879 RepID=UPI003D7746D4